MRINLKDKRFFKLWLIVMLVLTTASFVALPVLATSHDFGLFETAQRAGLTGFGSADDLPGKIGAVLFGLISFVGVLFLILTIYGGFLWMTAGGNTEKTKKAGTILRNGVIGLIIVLGSYAIVVFVFSVILSGTGASTSSASDPCAVATGRPRGCLCSSPSQCASNSCQFIPNPQFQTCQ